MTVLHIKNVSKDNRSLVSMAKNLLNLILDTVYVICNSLSFLLLDGINDDFEASHDLFRGAFKNGFSWELLKVLSGPPGPVIFTWRHWAEFNGTFQGRQGDGEMIEMYGLCRVLVNDKLKIQKIEVR